VEQIVRGVEIDEMGCHFSCFSLQIDRKLCRFFPGLVVHTESSEITEITEITDPTPAPSP
jgi:hypothetical protein